MIRAMSMYHSPPEPQVRPVGSPDPGSPTAARIAAILTVILMLVVVGFNQLGGRESAKATTPEAAVQPPDSSDPFALTAKLLVRMSHLWNFDPIARQQIMTNLKGSVRTNEDKVRLAMVAADLQGPEQAIKELEQLKDVGPPLNEDVRILREAYQSGARIGGDDAKLLEDHHGWFARLERTRGLPGTDPERAAVLAGAGPMLAFLFAFCAVALVAVLGALGCGITLLVLLANRRLKPAFVPPIPGGSVYIETVAVFILGYLALHLGLGLASHYASKNGEPPDWLIPVGLTAQWGLLILPFWPLARGVSWSDFRQRLGWTSGRGVLREVGAGVLGYFGALPLLLVVIGITVLILLVRAVIYKMMNAQEPGPPTNPIAEMLGKGSTFALVMLYVLATLWAPIVEEAIFRGCLYRHLRSRMGVLGAALLSALTFGFMHGYSAILLGPVICLGFVFALMREWRGSLIASMTAHCMHNATLLAIAILALSALKD
jgi:membrane protease YdiL (CAAX protease family)